MRDRKTVGFGCPTGIDPHHFTVDVPAGRGGEVVITERFGLAGGHNGIPEVVERCRLPRLAWASIADETKRVLNERLKEVDLPAGRWVPSENKVERLLGRELCVLAWAVEKAKAELIPTAVRGWLELRPEERWWLFAMAAAATGTADDADVGWRKAIRVALTESPTREEMNAQRAGKPRLAVARAVPDRPTLPLFDM